MGTVYFKDGSSEPITYYHKHNEDYIEFYAGGRKYLYLAYIERAHRLSQYRTYRFYESVIEKDLWDCWNEQWLSACEIDRIELKEDKTNGND